jgi:transcriptional regulator with XRE-family HTH domain
MLNVTIFVTGIKRNSAMYVTFLIKVRKEKRISQYEMSKRLGISRRQYIRIEDGSAGLSFAMFERICDELGLKVLLIDKSFFI